MKSLAWRLKYCECLLCLEKHSRNRRHLLGRFLSGMRMLNLQVCQRLCDIPQVEIRGSGSPDQAKKRKLPLERGLLYFALSSEELSGHDRLQPRSEGQQELRYVRFDSKYLYLLEPLCHSLGNNSVPNNGNTSSLVVHNLLNAATL